MAKEIGRLMTFGLGKEVTAGTPVAPTAWIPVESGKLKPIATLVKDESGLGTIVGMSDAHVAQTSSEFEAKGVVRPTSIGYLVLAALGTSAAPTTLETGVYKHSFTLANTNSHQSFTLVHDNQTQEEQSAYTMLDKIDFEAAVGNYARFTATMKGKLPVNTTGNTPTFLTTGDVPFVVSKASVKFAADQAGIAAANPVAVQTVKLSINKTLEQIFSTSSTVGTDATDFASQHNTVFEVTGDMEIVYDADTYKTLALAGTKRAMEIQLIGKSLIGATLYDNLTIQLMSVVLEEWDRTDDNNAIIKQTFGFTGLYKLSEAKAITIDLTNTKATQY